MDALEDSEPEVDGAEDSDTKETVLDVDHSLDAVLAKRKTMKLCGVINRLQVLILVDSGSVGSFVSKQLAQQITQEATACEPTQYVAADGSPMVCNTRIEKLHWSCQGHTFVSIVGILPLKCFDMILGQDWLESCSPMWVHWVKKQMRFTHQGKRVMLTGVTQDAKQCAPAHESKIKGLLKRQAITYCIQLHMVSDPHDSSLSECLESVAGVQESAIPSDIQKLLSIYEDVFQTPSALPPPRPFDHQIHLLLGAQPVNVRPHRYSPL